MYLREKYKTVLTALDSAWHRRSVNERYCQSTIPAQRLLCGCCTVHSHYSIWILPEIDKSLCQFWAVPEVTFVTPYFKLRMLNFSLSLSLSLSHTHPLSLSLYVYRELISWTNLRMLNTSKGWRFHRAFTVPSLCTQNHRKCYTLLQRVAYFMYKFMQICCVRMNHGKWAHINILKSPEGRTAFQYMPLCKSHRMRVIRYTAVQNV